MAVIGWLYMILGVAHIVAAVVLLPLGEHDRVKYPKWIRMNFLIMAGIFLISLSDLFINERKTMIFWAIGASVFAVIAMVAVAYICVFNVRIRSKDFVITTLRGKRAIAYDELTGVSAEIGKGITSIALTSGKNSVLLSKFMQGYGDFLDKLDKERVFVRFPIM